MFDPDGFEHPIRLREPEMEKIRQILTNLLPAEGIGVFLISRSGQELAAVAHVEPGDRQALASLAASTLAAASSLGYALGEPRIRRFLQWGRRLSMLLSPVGNQALLLLVLENRSQSRITARNLDRAALLLADLLGSGPGDAPIPSATG